jgi:hypothetical protein
MPALDDLRAWRAELAAQLEPLRQQLPALDAAHAAAEAEARSSAARRRELLAALACIERPSGIIFGRIKELHAAQDPAAGAAVRAKNDAVAARGQIECLEDAIGQLDRLLNAGATEPV